MAEGWLFMRSSRWCLTLPSSCDRMAQVFKKWIEDSLDQNELRVPVSVVGRMTTRIPKSIKKRLERIDPQDIMMSAKPLLSTCIKEGLRIHGRIAGEYCVSMLCDPKTPSSLVAAILDTVVSSAPDFRDRVLHDPMFLEAIGDPAYADRSGWNLLAAVADEVLSTAMLPTLCALVEQRRYNQALHAVDWSSAPHVFVPELAPLAGAQGSPSGIVMALLVAQRTSTRLATIVGWDQVYDVADASGFPCSLGEALIKWGIFNKRGENPPYTWGIVLYKTEATTTLLTHLVHQQAPDEVQVQKCIDRLLDTTVLEAVGGMPRGLGAQLLALLTALNPAAVDLGELAPERLSLLRYMPSDIVARYIDVVYAALRKHDVEARHKVLDIVLQHHNAFKQTCAETLLWVIRRANWDRIRALIALSYVDPVAVTAVLNDMAATGTDEVVDVVFSIACHNPSTLDPRALYWEHVRRDFCSGIMTCGSIVTVGDQQEAVMVEEVRPDGTYVVVGDRVAKLSDLMHVYGPVRITPRKILVLNAWEKVVKATSFLPTGAMECLRFMVRNHETVSLGLEDTLRAACEAASALCDVDALLSDLAAIPDLQDMFYMVVARRVRRTTRPDEWDILMLENPPADVLLQRHRGSGAPAWLVKVLLNGDMEDVTKLKESTIQPHLLYRALATHVRDYGLPTRRHTLNFLAAFSCSRRIYPAMDKVRPLRIADAEAEFFQELVEQMHRDWPRDSLLVKALQLLCRIYRASPKLVTTTVATLLLDMVPVHQLFNCMTHVMVEVLNQPLPPVLHYLWSLANEPLTRSKKRTRSSVGNGVRFNRDITIELLELMGYLVPE